MKKLTLLTIISTLIVSSIFSVAVAEKYTKFSRSFIKNFQDCDKYEETITSTFQDENFTTHRKILGWKNGFCRYEEIIKSPKDEYKLTCDLPAMQVDELYESMKDRSKETEKYELEIYGTRKDEKTGKLSHFVESTQTINGNRAYITWARIQNNPYYCVPTKLK